MQLYPEVMHHHLRSQEPCKYRVDDIHAWKQDIRRWAAARAKPARAWMRWRSARGRAPCCWPAP